MRSRLAPLELSQPLIAFALLRVLLALLAVALSLALELPDRGALLALTAGVALPWTLAVLVAAVRRPAVALNGAVMLGDLLLLGALQLAAPVSFGAVRPVALFLIAVQAHLGGKRRGVTAALLAIALLVVPASIQGAGSVDTDIRILWEVAFAVSAVSTGIVAGRLQTAETASWLRARELSRRTIRSESEVRRRVAETIHDGPVQELIGLDMVLSAADRALATGDPERAHSLVDEARSMAARNMRMLRDEILELGPYAFEELSFATAIERAVPAWQRRYDFEVVVSQEEIRLPPEMAGLLFRIAQEAVANAGRHARARRVTISLRSVGREVELRIDDDGHGFGGVDLFAPSEPGHLGLESMRERAELLDGRLTIDSSLRGTEVVVRAPLPPRA
jgi:signal transduction histidine kinase